MKNIALIDANSFYCQCEILFNPALLGRGVGVLSNNDGCVIARNDALKALKVPMGAAFFQVAHLTKTHNARFLSANFALYADMSNRFMSVVSQFTPDYFVYSVDECFASLDGFSSKDLTDYGREIRLKVLQWVGLPVCVGIACTHTLSKLANHVAKKRPEFGGVCNFNAMPTETFEPILSSLPVGEIWGVGSRLSARLSQMGVDTALDLKNAHSRTLRDNFSVVMAKTIAELNGISCIEFDQVRRPKQNIASSRSFGTPVTKIGDLMESVTLYTSRAAEKARAQKTHANSITVFIKTSPFSNQPYYSNSHTVALPSPSSDTGLLVNVAHWILKRIYRPGFVYQKAGVLLNDLVPDAGVQRDFFFDAPDIELKKRSEIMEALDAINQRYGRQTINVASQGFKAPWKMRQNFKSPNYTTNWGDLMKAV